MKKSVSLAFTTAFLTSSLFSASPLLLFPEKSVENHDLRVTTGFSGMPVEPTPTPGPATHFSVVAPVSTVPGQLFDFTVTALDQFNNPVTNYSGTIHFTSTETSANLPPNSGLTNGTGTFSAFFVGGKPGFSYTITATDTNNPSITGTSNDIELSPPPTLPPPTPTVSPTPRPATHLTLSAPASVSALVPFNFTVTALDDLNQTVTGYTGTIHFTSTDSGATLPPNSQLFGGHNTYSATLAAALTTQFITATDVSNPSIAGTSNGIDVGKEIPPSATPTPGTTATPTATQTPAATATPSSTPPPSFAQALNISVRMQVGTGNNILITGTIIGNGNGAKTLAVRGIGPSLQQLGVTDPLPDPVLELRDASGNLVIQDDNWQDDPDQFLQLVNLGIPLLDPDESGFVVTLNPGAYTALLSGNHGVTGVGLVEMYDINPNASELLNLSSRGLIETGNDVMISGFILGPGNDTHILTRGLGPSLTGVQGLADPTLELRDIDGTLIDSNDNCSDGCPPTMPSRKKHGPIPAGGCCSIDLCSSSSLDSCMYDLLPTGTYTAILAGKDGGTGVGLLEIYNLH